MTKRVKCTAICKEWKLINLHLLRPWSTCKVWISYVEWTFPQPFRVSFMIIQIIYKLNPTPFTLRALLRWWRKTIEMWWWWWWWKQNNRNVVAVVVVEGKQQKYGGGGGGGRKTIEMWWWWRETIEMWWRWWWWWKETFEVKGKTIEFWWWWSWGRKTIEFYGLKPI